MLSTRYTIQIQRHKQNGIHTYTYTHTRHADSEKKRAEVTILISDKINFKTRIVIRHKEGHFKMTKKFIKRI